MARLRHRVARVCQRQLRLVFVLVSVVLINRVTDSIVSKCYNRHNIFGQCRSLRGVTRRQKNLTILSLNLITGPPTHSVSGSIVYLSGICRRLSSSVTLHGGL